MQIYVTKNPSNLKRPWEKNPKFDKRMAFNKAVGPGKFQNDKRRAYVYSGL